MIRFLYRFPVKGLSAETPTELDLIKDEGIPGDRAVAIARDGDRFNPSAPQALSKTNFLMLMKDEALARLKPSYDAATHSLTIDSAETGKLVTRLGEPTEVKKLGEFFRTFLADGDLEPTPVRAPGHKFTDLSVVSPAKMRAVSLINLASVRQFEEELGQSVDHRRFRGNIVYDSTRAWDEFDWLNKMVRIGSATAKIVKRTKRCAATEVNPDTAARDIKLPFELRRLYGHMDMGIYAEVLESGSVKIGDTIDLV